MNFSIFCVFTCFSFVSQLLNQLRIRLIQHLIFVKEFDVVGSGFFYKIEKDRRQNVFCSFRSNLDLDMLGTLKWSSCELRYLWSWPEMVVKWPIHNFVSILAHKKYFSIYNFFKITSDAGNFVPNICFYCELWLYYRFFIFIGRFFSISLSDSFLLHRANLSCQKL